MLKYIFIILAFLCSACSDYQLIDRQVTKTVENVDQIDILLAVDYSCSMMSEAKVIHYGLANNLDWLAQQEYDYHLGYTSTDPSKGFFRDLTNNPNPGWILADLFATPYYITGEGEAGFDATLKIKELYPDFFRPTATPIIIIVSDEEDQSKITANEWFTYWPTDVLLAAMVGTGTNVSRLNNCDADYAPLYIDAADYTIDICDPGPWNIIQSVLGL